MLVHQTSRYGVRKGGRRKKKQTNGSRTFINPMQSYWYALLGEREVLNKTGDSIKWNVINGGVLTIPLYRF